MTQPKTNTPQPLPPMDAARHQDPPNPGEAQRNARQDAQDLHPPRPQTSVPPDPNLLRPADQDIEEGHERIVNPPTGPNERIPQRPPGQVRSVSE